MLINKLHNTIKYYVSCNYEDMKNLILLIGTNPLPNFVVAKYFLKHNQNLRKIWLVNSRETKEQKDNLEKILKNNLENAHADLSFSSIELSDVNSAKQIKNDIKNLLISQFPNNASVHLNYTGGTKVMCTHIYRTIEHSNITNKSFSYLDGRNFNIVDDETGIINDKDLRKEINIDFNELIELHGFRRKNEDSEFLFDDAVNQFKTIIEENRISEWFDKNNGGYNRKLFEKKNKPGCLATTKSQLNEELNNFRPNKTFFSIINSLPNDYQIFNLQGILTIPENNKNIESFIEFIDGLWLEQHVYNILKNQFENNLRLLKNWKIKKPEWSGKLDFELDVILLNGYQLTGISCTTASEKYLCKSKGFEIILRTHQIGGDEAKAILITCANDEKITELQEELQLETGGSENILVLGIDDLKENILFEKINNFVKG